MELAERSLDVAEVDDVAVTRMLRETKDRTVWKFVCEGCGAEGELGLFKRDGMKPFGCPEGCGATYVPWKPDGKRWQLRCVVKPYFAEARP